MIRYQQRILDGGDVGEPGPLPPELVGLDDASLANLSWADASLGYVGRGFFPVEVQEPAPPAEPRRLPRIAFLQRIAVGTRLAIRAAAKTDPLIEDFLDLLAATATVELDHADTVAGLGYLVAEGLLTTQEQSAIRA